MVEFVVGTDGGYFCAECPVVVLDTGEFANLARLGSQEPGESVAFAVLGIVDLETVPEDKKHLPIDDENNPMPLVKFTNVEASSRNPRERAKLRAKKKRKHKK